jgi:hypothetical protein
VRFTYVANLCVEGKHAFTMYSKDITDVGTETATYQVLPLEMMFILWTVYVTALSCSHILAF